MASVTPGIGSILARAKDIDLDPIMDEIAAEVKANAIGLAADHLLTTDYVRSIEVGVDRKSPSRRDRIVYSDDPGAVSIEWGHLSGSRTDSDRTPVEGQHILGRAIDAVGGGA